MFTETLWRLYKSTRTAGISAIEEKEHQALKRLLFLYFRTKMYEKYFE